MPGRSMGKDQGSNDSLSIHWKDFRVIEVLWSNFYASFVTTSSFLGMCASATRKLFT
jgi:hypothetical protein